MPNASICQTKPRGRGATPILLLVAGRSGEKTRCAVSALCITVFMRRGLGLEVLTACCLPCVASASLVWALPCLLSWLFSARAGVEERRGGGGRAAASSPARPGQGQARAPV
jgi:hypothetical protein